ncbi:MAG TPA: hypothetical protein VMV10_24755 [Pirellulales bacterium]|nr:hypothetical protein [Pirellulales bacterium]
MQAHAEFTGAGVLLSGIAVEADVEDLCSLFRDAGVQPDVGTLSYDNQYYVFLPGLTLEELKQQTASANLRLV